MRVRVNEFKDSIDRDTRIVENIDQYKKILKEIEDKNFKYNRLKNDKTAIGRLYKQAYEFAKRTQKDAQEL